MTLLRLFSLFLLPILGTQAYEQGANASIVLTPLLSNHVPTFHSEAGASSLKVLFARQEECPPGFRKFLKNSIFIESVVDSISLLAELCPNGRCCSAESPVCVCFSWDSYHLPSELISVSSAPTDVVSLVTM